MSADTNDVRVCRDAAVNCPAGESECAESHSGCMGGNDPANSCQPSLTRGRFASSAMRQAARITMWMPIGKRQLLASRATRNFASFGVIAAAVAAVSLVLIAAWRSWRVLPAKWRDRLTKLLATYHIGTKLKVHHRLLSDRL